MLNSPTNHTQENKKKKKRKYTRKTNRMNNITQLYYKPVSNFRRLHEIIVVK